MVSASVPMKLMAAASQCSTKAIGSRHKAVSSELHKTTFTMPQRSISAGVSRAVGTPVRRPTAAIAPISAVETANC